MRKLLMLSIFRLGLILMTLFLIALVVIYFLELGFEITHGPSNFVFAVLTTVFFIPLIFLSFFGVAFFNQKIEEERQLTAKAS